MFKVPFTENGKTQYHEFALPPHIQPMASLGAGRYGAVIRAEDVTTGANVAIKKIAGYTSDGKGCFENRGDTKRILREVKILKHFREPFHHPNLLRLLDVLPPSSYDDFKDIYFVTDLHDTTLETIIRTNVLSEMHHRAILLQLIRGINHLHKAGVFHRDLKPANILMDANCHITVADFGLGRTTPQPLDFLTGGQYVVTRAYRAPELLLRATQYGPEVDMWSIGCIMVELKNRKSLFAAGGDETLQLCNLSKILGKPTPEDFGPAFSDVMNSRLHLVPPTTGYGLDAVLPDDCPADFTDLVSQMLRINPRERITAEAALAHPYFASVLSLFPAPVVGAPAKMKFKFEERVPPHTADELRALIYDEIRSFHPGLPERHDIKEIPAIVDTPESPSMAAGDVIAMAAAEAGPSDASPSQAAGSSLETPSYAVHAKNSESAILIEPSPMDESFTPVLPTPSPSAPGSA